jgi:hypothetical protein
MMYQEKSGNPDWDRSELVGGDQLLLEPLFLGREFEVGKIAIARAIDGVFTKNFERQIVEIQNGDQGYQMVYSLTKNPNFRWILEGLGVENFGIF